VEHGDGVVTSEFSLPSAMSKVETIASLRDTNRGMYEKMLKTAAAMQVVTMAKGVYRK
jgi:hypothetical protein